MVSPSKIKRRERNARLTPEQMAWERRDKWKSRAEIAEASNRTLQRKIARMEAAGRNLAVPAPLTPGSVLALEKEILKYKNLYVFFKSKGERTTKELELRKERIRELSVLTDRLKYRNKALLNYFDPNNGTMI